MKSKKMVNPITPEHNGPNGHKIPDFFQSIAQNLPQPPDQAQIPMRPGDQKEDLQYQVGGQNLQFLGPQGLVHGGPNTDVVGEQFPVETVGESVEYKDGMPVDKDYTIRKR